MGQMGPNRSVNTGKNGSKQVKQIEIGKTVQIKSNRSKRVKTGPMCQIRSKLV